MNFLFVPQSNWKTSESLFTELHRHVTYKCFFGVRLSCQSPKGNEKCVMTVSSNKESSKTLQSLERSGLSLFYRVPLFFSLPSSPSGGRFLVIRLQEVPFSRRVYTSLWRGSETRTGRGSTSFRILKCEITRYMKFSKLLLAYTDIVP